jgi:hypothetical protein
MSCPIAWHVLRASTQSKMGHRLTQRASTVRQAPISRQKATMQSQIA